MTTPKTRPAKSGNGKAPSKSAPRRKKVAEVATTTVAKLTGTKGKVSKEVAEFIATKPNRLSVEDSDASRPKLRVFVDGKSEGLFISQKADGTLRVRNRPIFNLTTSTVSSGKSQPGCSKMPSYPNSAKGLAQATLWWVDNVHRKTKGEQVAPSGGRKRTTAKDSKSLVKQTSAATAAKSASKAASKAKSSK